MNPSFASLNGEPGTHAAAAASAGGVGDAGAAPAASAASARVAELEALGHQLARPECVLVTASGSVWCADWRGGVSRLHLGSPDAEARRWITPRNDGGTLRPNGIALQADGSLLLAQLGEADGGVWRLQAPGPADGHAVPPATPWLLEVDGHALPPTNFVSAGGARQGYRTWVTVSTRHQPRASAYRPDVADGFIVCCDGSDPARARQARIVADGLGYTNEVAEHGGFLYVVETFARRLSRLPLRADGTLGARQTVTTFGEGEFPDGLAFDEQGHAWVACIVANRLIRVAPDGSQNRWLDDADPDHLAWVVTAFGRGEMGRAHLDRAVGRRLGNLSSLAFVPGRREALLGSLQGEVLWRVPMPCQGASLPHWEYDA